MDTEVKIFHGGRNETPCNQPLSLFRYHGFFTIGIVWTCRIKELKICTTFFVVALLLNGGKSQNVQVKFLGLKQNQEFLLEIGNIIVKAKRSVKLLGTTVDNELKFEKHVKTLCQKVCKKVCVLKGSTLHGRKETENPVSYIHSVKFQLLSIYLNVL